MANRRRDPHRGDVAEYAPTHAASPDEITWSVTPADASGADNRVVIQRSCRQRVRSGGDAVNVAPQSVDAPLWAIPVPRMLVLLGLGLIVAGLF